MNSIPHKSAGKINPRKIHKTYLDNMEDSLKSKGVILFDEQYLNINLEYLSLPSEVTDIPSRDLGEYLNAYTQQKVYLRTMLGRAELLTEEARRAYYEASKELYRKYSVDKLSETAKERLITSNEEVRPYYYEYLDCKKKQEIIEYSISNIEDIIFMLSREVTRRTGDFSEESRNYNVNRR